MKSASKKLLIVTVVLLVLCVAATTASAKGPSAGTLQGTTSQGLPGYVKTSVAGIFITKTSIPIEVKCSFGTMLLPQRFELVQVSRGGRFKETAEGSAVEEGVSMRLFESFSGKFNRQRTRVVTKSRIYLTFHNPDGSVETCDSGTVTMHAHR